MKTETRKLEKLLSDALRPNGQNETFHDELTGILNDLDAAVQIALCSNNPNLYSGLKAAFNAVSTCFYLLSIFYSYCNR